MSGQPPPELEKKPVRQIGKTILVNQERAFFEKMPSPVVEREPGRTTYSYPSGLIIVDDDQDPQALGVSSSKR